MVEGILLDHRCSFQSTQKYPVVTIRRQAYSIAVLNLQKKKEKKELLQTHEGTQEKVYSVQRKEPLLIFGGLCKWSEGGFL